MIASPFQMTPTAFIGLMVWIMIVGYCLACVIVEVRKGSAK